MMRAIALLLIGLTFGGGIGFVIGASSGATPVDAPAMDHSSHAHSHGEVLMIDPGLDVPELAVALYPDPVLGWNLNIAVEKFRFAAERAGLEHVPGEGHAHVYVNGEKVARAYGAWLHLEHLPFGSVEIEVTLNANDHRALMVGNVPVSATLSFENPA